MAEMPELTNEQLLKFAEDSGLVDTTDLVIVQPPCTDSPSCPCEKCQTRLRGMLRTFSNRIKSTTETKEHPPLNRRQRRRLKKLRSRGVNRS